MFLISILLAAFSVHLSVVQAYEFSATKLCTTNYGAKSTAVNTSSYTVTVPITVLKKLNTTLTSTITPAPATTMSTETVTTTSVVLTTPTETFTDTVSTKSTLTTTQISFEEATTTTSTTTSVATSTVPTAPGFTPLASASGYVAKRSSEDAAAPAIRGRRVEERAAAPQKPSCPLRSANRARSANSHNRSSVVLWSLQRPPVPGHSPRQTRPPPPYPLPQAPSP
ncbi:hypothetical protein XPA_010021 [Xanthoria parietina]